jgi:hypothetical protein
VAYKRAASRALPHSSMLHLRQFIDGNHFYTLFLRLYSISDQFERMHECGPIRSSFLSDDVFTIPFRGRLFMIKSAIGRQRLQIRRIWIMNIVETINLAQVSRKNGQSTETEQHDAAKIAVANSISNRSFLWSRMFLEIANGDVKTARKWLEEREVGFGDFYDNAESWTAIQYMLDNGKVEEGLERACLLREFISQRGDANSVAWLLPQIDAHLSIWGAHSQIR